MRGKRSTPADFWKHVNQQGNDECWPWMTASTSNGGYGSVRYHQKTYNASRLAWILTHGDPRELYVLHSCDNPPCCNPRHLFLGTHLENIEDSRQKGRHPRNVGHYLPTGDRHHSHLRPEVVARGERQARAKLKNDQIPEIREKLSCGQSQRSLAKEYGVSQSTILHIHQGTAWKHVA